MKTFRQLSEDIEQRRQKLRQRQQQQMQTHKDRVASYQRAQREKREKAQEKEELKAEIKRELQTEQVPTMVRPGEEPNLYNKMITASQIRRKARREIHAQQEMGSAASAQQAQKRAVMRAIMSR